VLLLPLRGRDAGAGVAPGRHRGGAAPLTVEASTKMRAALPDLGGAALFCVAAGGRRRIYVRSADLPRKGLSGGFPAAR
jgi:hypothetical protein